MAVLEQFTKTICGHDVSGQQRLLGGYIGNQTQSEDHARHKGRKEQVRGLLRQDTVLWKPLVQEIIPQVPEAEMEDALRVRRSGAHRTNWLSVRVRMRSMATRCTEFERGRQAIGPFRNHRGQPTRVAVSREARCCWVRRSTAGAVPTEGCER